MKPNQNILLSRIDAIGDVVLSLPVAGILKNLFPDCKIYFLGQAYTKDVIESSQYIDYYIDWSEIKRLTPLAQIEYFKKLDIAVAIHIYPNFYISWLLKTAGIPIRIGTSRRWYHHLFCNKRVSFSRRSSNLHEVQLNLKLLIPFGLTQTLSFDAISNLNGLVPPAISNELESLLDKDRFNLILHPKSRGHGKEWGVENYSKLIGLLDPSKYKVFITGTIQEKKEIQQEMAFKHPEVIDLVGKMSLTELVGFISKADGLVASGTGPLHMAAALGIHAIGLFPPIRPVFSRRWSPVGVYAKAFEAKKICVKCKKNAKCDCLKLFRPEIIADYLHNVQKPKHHPFASTNIFKPADKSLSDYKIQQTNFFELFVKNTKLKVFVPGEYLNKKNRIVISLDKINKPNCGLGRVSIDFSKAVINTSNGNNDFSFVLTGDNKFDYLKEQHTRRFKFINRLFPAFLGDIEVLHYLHQTPSFKVRGASKTVLTIHDLNFLLTKSQVKANRYLRAVQNNVDNADVIVFISNFTKEICYKNLVIPPDKKTKVIYNGVELPSEEPTKPDFIVNDDPFLFTIGQCFAKKNFHVLIPFLQSMPQKMKLIIAGENTTSYGSYVKRMIIANNLEKYVIMPGQIKESEKLYLYQHCQAFVFPSLAEGFGLPIIEAMRLRKPVFCSDRTSLKEIGDRYVYFWKTFEPEAMLEVYNFGMNDFDENKKELAYNYSLQYTWEKNAEEYIKLYKSVINGH